MAGRWGEAGVRLDPQEQEARRRKILADRNRGMVREWLQAENGFRLWRAGRLVPYRITFALDAVGAEGPEVDIECKAQEPDVDHWELGIKYPTWAQTEALCRLTGCTVEFLCRDDKPLRARETSMAYHLKKSELSELERLERERVGRFLPAAIAATLEGREYVHEPTQEALW